MKRGIAILLAALLLGLCACSPTGADASEPGGTQPVTQPATQPATRGTEPETTSEPPTQQSATDATAQTPEEPEINEAFTAAAPDAPDGALGVMFNEPFDALDLTATQLGPAGEYDRAYIVAKYVGSWVNVFSVTWESGRLNVGDKALYSFRTGQGDVISGSFDRPDGGAMYYLTVTAPDGTDFGEYLTYNGRWGSPQKEYLMDTCWNAEAVLREAAGADEDWELYDSRLIQDDGIPYVCFRLEGETEQYALVPPDGSCVYAAELDPNTDRYCITGVF